MKVKSNLKGILFIVIATIIFGLMPLFAKEIYKNGGNPVSLVLYRALIATPVLYLINKKRNIDLTISKNELIKISVLSIFGYSSTAILLYLSYNYISTGLATTIHFVYPVLVTLGCTVIYKEKLNFSKILAVILSTLGILLFLNNVGDLNFLGIGLSLLSGVTFAFYIVYFDKSGLSQMDSLKATYYLCVITSIVVFIFSIITKTFTYKMTLYGWVLMIMFSLVVSIGAVTLFQHGITLVGAQTASVTSTFEPITSIIVGVLIFNEAFNFRIFLGCVIILLAVIISTLEGGSSQCTEKIRVVND